MIPTHKCAAEIESTNDPHDEMAAQNIEARLDGGWVMKRKCGDETMRTLLMVIDTEFVHEHLRASPTVASSRLALQVHC